MASGRKVGAQRGTERSPARAPPALVGAVLAFLACLSVGIAGGYLPTKTYTTSATLSVEPVVTPSGGNVQTANFLIPSIIARVESASFRHDIQSVLSKDDLSQPV